MDELIKALNENQEQLETISTLLDKMIETQQDLLTKLQQYGKESSL